MFGLVRGLKRIGEGDQADIFSCVCQPGSSNMVNRSRSYDTCVQSHTVDQHHNVLTFSPRLGDAQNHRGLDAFIFFFKKQGQYQI